jgi:primosomal protein N' (replication factor Y)
VRVPLGSREEIAFIVSAPQLRESDRPLRRVLDAPNVPRAFDETGLALAQFIAQYYVCTLGEALGGVVLSAAIPRTVDVFVLAADAPARDRYPSVPARLIRLLWEEFTQGFALEQLLRHPDARRAGDRSTLLRHVNTLARSGAIKRLRRIADPRTHEYRIKVLYPGEHDIRGPKAVALRDFVREQPGVPRADALLAGFSNAILARAIKAGAIREEEVAPARLRAQHRIGAAAFAPTPEQAHAIQALVEHLNADAFHETLLHGITGSGKTYVYIEAIKQVLRTGGRALVLVPEISLTPQTARRFEQAFGERVAVLHSALSTRERYDAWQACARGEVDVVVGARSAVFAPLRNVRMLIVDEAHETSYKQDSTPRYHAVTVARERMRLEKGVLVLGSATPSLESYDAARSGRIELLALPARASGQDLPAVHVVDMAEELQAGNRRIFSTALAQALDERLRRGEKSVLFVNRRGSAGFMLCRRCGFVPECERCSVSMTVHRGEGLLRCHYCDAQDTLPRVCPECGADTIREFGVGTQRVAEEVTRLFPDARVVRMDSDTTTRIGDHARLLDEFGTSGEVLVGTQMVAKGLDFPTVTLVGVVAADIGLHAADFRAAERSFALIAQVCGRSGRARPGEAIVQTYCPEHTAIVHAAAHDYDGFAAAELAQRRELGYPPARELAYLGIIGRNRAKVLAHAKQYADMAEEARIADVLGPAPYPIARLNNEWRFRVALKAADLQPVRALLRERIMPAARANRESRLAINVDP